jgi:hypothetical protein
LESFRIRNGIIGEVTFVVSNIEITLRDSRGVEFPSQPEPWLRNKEADICILETSINRRPVPVARSEPEFGEQVINISAPYGLMFTSPDGGAVYITDGRYSGNFSMPEGARSMYVIWTAPGSSGSPIINERGEIVGMVSAISMLTWPQLNSWQTGVVSAPSNITFGPTLEQIRFSIDEGVAAMKRGKPFVYSHSVPVATPSEEILPPPEEDTGDTGTDGSDYLFPYFYDWR